METLDPIACYRALQTRDPRFDGRLYIGVTSTGIYCRPICPARTSRFENCRFFPSAAAASEAGFRPCLRCRPETAPGSGAWRGTSNTVRRALCLIAEGAVDGDEGSLETLAGRVGVGSRQLRRLFQQHIGASPLAVAQTKRILFAKHLIHDTMMPMAEVALAAGFNSIRRFNETFQQLYGRPPSALRQRRGTGVEVTATAGVELLLRYRPPYDWAGMLDRLRREADRAETVADGRYHRHLVLDGEAGGVTVRHVPARDSLAATIIFPRLQSLPTIVARLRRRLDLDADMAMISQHLSQDATLAPLLATRPGLRVPGGWEGEITPAASPTITPDRLAAWRPWDAYALALLEAGAGT